LPRLKAFKWQEWSEWVEREIALDGPDTIAVDTETSGLGHHDLAFCATASWRGRDGSLKSGYIDLEDEGREERIALLSRVLDDVPTWVFHNAKFDLQKLDYIGALPAQSPETQPVRDTQPLAALLDENRRMALKSLAVTELGIEDVVEVIVKSGPNKGSTKRVPREEHHLNAVRRKLKLTKDDGYHLLPREALVPYAIRDTELTLLLYEKLAPKIPPDLTPVYDEELEVSRILRAMEGNGVGIDVPYLEEANDEWGALVMTRWQALVQLVGREDFNANSVPQLKAAFQAAGVTLESTDKAHLRDMVANKASPKKAVELAEALREYRDAEKVYGTYLSPLLREQRDGIAHPWLNAVGPRTGRMSSSKATND
jgi:DNA polymerase I-like protein with 3'-5' exonuclease and polymerase domains